jgi:hypothetical protein
MDTAPAEEGDPRIELLRDARDAYRAEYQILSERWKTLETKAQGTVAIAGIFLGGIFSFIKDLNTASPTLERWLLSLLAVLLGISVAFSVVALRVREIADPLPGEEAERMVLAVCSLPREEIPDRLPDLYGEQFHVWKDVNARMRDCVTTKAARLGRGQIWLLFAALLMCVMSVALALAN